MTRTVMTTATATTTTRRVIVALEVCLARREGQLDTQMVQRRRRATAAAEAAPIWLSQSALSGRESLIGRFLSLQQMSKSTESERPPWGHGSRRRVTFGYPGPGILGVKDSGYRLVEGTE